MNSRANTHIRVYLTLQRCLSIRKSTLIVCVLHPLILEAGFRRSKERKSVYASVLSSSGPKLALTEVWLRPIAIDCTIS